MNAKGPWDLFVEQLHGQILGVASLQEKFSSLKLRMKEQEEGIVTMETTLRDVNKVKSTLESRVADLQIKTEKVVILENENKRLIELEQYTQSQMSEKTHECLGLASSLSAQE